MNKLYAIILINGSSYIVKEEDKEIFFKSQIYILKQGCIMTSSVDPQGQLNTMLYDLLKNKFFTLPYLINRMNIVEVKSIKKDSELEALYLKVTSRIILPSSETIN